MTRKLPLWCTLQQDSPRYQDWLGILGVRDVPLVSAKAIRRRLGDGDIDYVYALDVQRLSRKQFERLSSFIVDRFGCVRREAEEMLQSDGFPIRATDVRFVDLKAYL